MISVQTDPHASWSECKYPYLGVNFTLSYQYFPPPHFISTPHLINDLDLIPLSRIGIGSHGELQNNYLKINTTGMSLITGYLKNKNKARSIFHPKVQSLQPWQSCKKKVVLLPVPTAFCGSLAHKCVCSHSMIRVYLKMPLTTAFLRTLHLYERIQKGHVSIFHYRQNYFKTQLVKVSCSRRPEFECFPVKTCQTTQPFPNLVDGGLRCRSCLPQDVNSRNLLGTGNRRELTAGR